MSTEEQKLIDKIAQALGRDLGWVQIDDISRVCARERTALLEQQNHKKRGRVNSQQTLSSEAQASGLLVFTPISTTILIDGPRELWPLSVSDSTSASTSSSKTQTTVPSSIHVHDIRSFENFTLVQQEQKQKQSEDQHSTLILGNHIVGSGVHFSQISSCLSCKSHTSPFLSDEIEMPTALKLDNEKHLSDTSTTQLHTDMKLERDMERESLGKSSMFHFSNWFRLAKEMAFDPNAKIFIGPEECGFPSTLTQVLSGAVYTLIKQQIPPSVFDKMNQENRDQNKEAPDGIKADVTLGSKGVEKGLGSLRADVDKRNWSKGLALDLVVPTQTTMLGRHLITEAVHDACLTFKMPISIRNVFSYASCLAISFMNSKQALPLLLENNGVVRAIVVEISEEFICVSIVSLEAAGDAFYDYPVPVDYDSDSGCGKAHSRDASQNSDASSGMLKKKKKKIHRKKGVKDLDDWTAAIEEFSPQRQNSNPNPNPNPMTNAPNAAKSQQSPLSPNRNMSQAQKKKKSAISATSATNVASPSPLTQKAKLKQKSPRGMFNFPAKCVRVESSAGTDAFGLREADAIFVQTWLTTLIDATSRRKSINLQTYNNTNGKVNPSIQSAHGKANDFTKKQPTTSGGQLWQNLTEDKRMEALSAVAKFRYSDSEQSLPTSEAINILCDKLIAIIFESAAGFPFLYAFSIITARQYLLSAWVKYTSNGGTNSFEATMRRTIQVALQGRLREQNDYIVSSGSSKKAAQVTVDIPRIDAVLLSHDKRESARNTVDARQPTNTLDASASKDLHDMLDSILRNELGPLMGVEPLSAKQRQLQEQEKDQRQQKPSSIVLASTASSSSSASQGVRDNTANGSRFVEIDETTNDKKGLSRENISVISEISNHDSSREKTMSPSSAFSDSSFPTTKSGTIGNWDDIGEAMVGFLVGGVSSAAPSVSTTNTRNEISSGEASRDSEGLWTQMGTVWTKRSQKSKFSEATQSTLHDHSPLQAVQSQSPFTAKKKPSTTGAYIGGGGLGGSPRNSLRAMIEALGDDDDDDDDDDEEEEGMDSKEIVKNGHTAFDKKNTRETSSSGHHTTATFHSKASKSPSKQSSSLKSKYRDPKASNPTGVASNNESDACIRKDVTVMKPTENGPMKLWVLLPDQFQIALLMSHYLDVNFNPPYNSSTPQSLTTYPHVFEVPPHAIGIQFTCADKKCPISNTVWIYDPITVASARLSPPSLTQHFRDHCRVILLGDDINADNILVYLNTNFDPNCDTFQPISTLLIGSLHLNHNDILAKSRSDAGTNIQLSLVQKGFKLCGNGLEESITTIIHSFPIPSITSSISSSSSTMYDASYRNLLFSMRLEGGLLSAYLHPISSASPGVWTQPFSHLKKSSKEEIVAFASWDANAISHSSVGEQDDSNAMYRDDRASHTSKARFPSRTMKTQNEFGARVIIFILIIIVILGSHGTFLDKHLRAHRSYIISKFSEMSETDLVVRARCKFMGNCGSKDKVDNNPLSNQASRDPKAPKNPLKKLKSVFGKIFRKQIKTE